MLKPTNVYDYIIQETAKFKTERVPLVDNWDWNMFEHIQRTTLYKHGKFWKGENDGERPNKNIILPILRVQYRTEGFDVKDIVPYVNDEKNYYKSFFVKKFHPKWAKLNDIDGFIDDFSESVIDYGLGLAKNVNSKRPEAVPLQRLAFCDQTDIMSGPICEMHPYSVDQLQAMAGRWDADRIDEAITMAQAEKPITPKGEKKTKTPGKYIEVYELHGMFPESWLDNDTETFDDSKYSKQIHIVTYYTLENGEKQGITLFKGPERRSIYKAFKRDPIFGRACGYGGVEELFEPQTWTNYSEIQIKEMLDVATMIILQTTDQAFANRNNVNDFEKGEIVVTENGGELKQANIQPFNKEKFDNATERWEQHAMTTGSASEGSLGKNPSSGTPFALQNLIVQEGNGMHDYRRGKLAAFIGNEVYPEWVMPSLVREMLAGQKWLDELSADEMAEVVDAVVTNTANERIKAKMMQGTLPTPEEDAAFKEITKAQFLKAGSNRFLEIIKDELKDIPTDVFVNVAGKQEYLAERAEKLTNIFRAVIANPAILQQPGMGKLFNEIIESAGFSPLDFSSFTKAPAVPVEGGDPNAVPSPVKLETNA